MDKESELIKKITSYLYVIMHLPNLSFLERKILLRCSLNLTNQDWWSLRTYKNELEVWFAAELRAAGELKSARIYKK